MIFTKTEKFGHEKVLFVQDAKSGLKAIIAVHNNVLGPALGGCRVRAYKSEEQALEDVLRLSQGMTYKNSIAGLDLGGGKACIISDPNIINGRAELFKSFGKAVNSLGGIYITAEDMGTSPDDMQIVKQETKYVSGLARELGGPGDPSPWTALGIYYAMKAACKKYFQDESLKGRKISVQGTGHVGMYLLEHLSKEGAEVVVCDPNKNLIYLAKSKFGVKAVELDQIYDQEVDIFSPCAVGQTVNSETLKRLKTKIICGAANNQLSSKEVYQTIQAKGIMYCPDFVVNSGGVINCASEFRPGGYSEAWVTDKVSQIYSTTLRVLEAAEKSNQFPEITATELAKDRIAKA